MANCIGFTDIEELTSCDGDNVPGTAAEVEIGLADDVLTWPSHPSGSSVTSLTFMQAGSIVGNLVLKTGATRCKMVFTRNTGEFTLTEQGDAGSENVLYSLSLERSKMNAEIFGFLNATRGRRLWIKVTDKNGQKYLMGDAVNQAYRVAADAATTGKATTDANKVPIKFEYVSPRHLVFDGEVEATGAAGASAAAAQSLDE